MGTERWRHNASLPHRELVINEARACQLPSRVLLQIGEREESESTLGAGVVLGCSYSATSRAGLLLLSVGLGGARVAWNCLMNVKALMWPLRNSLFCSFVKKSLQRLFTSRGCDESVEITNDSACATRIISQFILQETINPRKFHALMLPSE